MIIPNNFPLSTIKMVADGEALFCGVIQHLILRGSSCPITLVSTHFHGEMSPSECSLEKKCPIITIYTHSRNYKGFYKRVSVT
jgi:hypothetical protein